MKWCLILTLLFLPYSVSADEWGTWDDLPDNLLQDTNAAELIGELDRLFVDNPNQTTGELDLWLANLNLRLNMSEEELAELFESLDEKETEELEDWLEDRLEEQEDALEDEDDELEEEDEDDDEDEEDSN
jgi:isopropylmalate/homocitrate/citramalate synthase